MLSGGLRTKGITKQTQENMPLITVVTVVRNSEAMLEETILSVINQSYSNIEYIVVDGASTDGTLDIVKKYEDKIDYWMSEPDKGIYDAMNKGIDLATGEWINFMNSGDTFYASDTIRKLFIVDHKTDIIYGDCVSVFTYMSIVFMADLLCKMDRQPPFCHQSSFVKSVLLKKYKFNVKYRICADYDFFYNCYKKGYSFKYISEVISNFDATGISNNSFLLVYKERRLISGKGDAILLISITKYLARKFIENIFPKSIIKKLRILLYQKNPLVKEIIINN